MQILSIRKFAVLAGLATLVLPASSRADIIITAQQDGGASTTNTVATGTPDVSGGVTYTPTGTQSFGNFTFNSSSASETQLPVGSEVLSSSLSITNTDTTSAHTLHIIIEASKFTAPSTPPNVMLASNFSGTAPHLIGGGTGNTATFQSSVLALGANATTLQSPDITTGAGFTAPEEDRVLTSGLTNMSPGYSVFQELFITLNAGATLNFTGRTDLTPLAATPEPATVAMALTALPLLGIGAFLRRRRARA